MATTRCSARKNAPACASSASSSFALMLCARCALPHYIRSQKGKESARGAERDALGRPEEMFHEHAAAACYRAAQENKEEPRGPGAAFCNGRDQEQQKGIERNMGEIVM